MSRDYAEVQVTQTGETQRLSHPSFGLVSVSEVTGRSVMFGSELVHDRVLRIRLKAATQERSLSNDWNHEAGLIAEFDMTHGQFAQFISSHSGRNTPATLRSIRSGSLESIVQIDRERMPPKIEQFREEMRTAVGRVMTRSDVAFEKLNEALASANISAKLREQLKSLAIQAKGGLDTLPSTLGFILEQAHEAAETVSNDAKVSLEAYALCRLQEAATLDKHSASEKPVSAIPLIAIEHL